MTEITSWQNSKVKQVRALGARKARREEGLFVVEGLFHIGTALEAGTEFEYVLYVPELTDGGYAQELVGQLRTAGVPLHTTTEEIMESLAGKDNPQGMLAVIKWKQVDLKALTASTHPWLVAVTEPQDPGNLGTLLRTIDAVGADGLIVLDGGVDPTHPAAVRAGMGAHFWLPVVEASFADLAAWARVNGYSIYGTSAKGASDYATVTYQKPAILLLGSEREGLSEMQRAVCKEFIKLPMEGHATSLNLGVAAGVMLYKMAESFRAK